MREEVKQYRCRVEDIDCAACAAKRESLMFPCPI